METMKQRQRDKESERGQSIVLVALMFIGLLGLVGLAVDVGFIFARRSQLSSAVDAAALAGVVELTNSATEQEDALHRAAEFLRANNIPEPVILATVSDARNYAFDADQNSSTLGARNFAITVTWPVELFFLQVLGFEKADIVESATAANFPLADIYASRRVEIGALTTSNQAVFGPNICVDNGDPFSAMFDSRAITFRQRWWGDASRRTYRYRILIPPDYPDDILRVELFDPDSINKPNNDGNRYRDLVSHTQTAIALGDPIDELLSCTADRKNPCLIDTGETALRIGGNPVDPDLVNQWWFVRIDENRGGSPGSCTEPGSYTATQNTQTLYELYYYRRSDDGVIERVNLASYTGQVGDGLRDNGNHDTDMRWVSPGGQLSYDQTVPVPADPGSPNGGVTSQGKGQGFEIEIENDLYNIFVDQATGNRYVYLDVTTLSGGSENGFEIWAGPDDYVSTVASDVNARNVQVINNPSSHSSRGVTVFGLGHLPMNSNVNNAVNIPLIYVGPEYAGTTIFISNYDSDSGATWPVNFYFDSIAQSDWSVTFGNPNVQPDPDGVDSRDASANPRRCIIGGASGFLNCSTRWIDPPWALQVPTYDPERCTNPSNPAQRNVCTPFYGGRLMVNYRGGNHDTYHWNISLTGLPYLIR